MKWLGRLFDNPKPALWLIVVVVLTLIVLWAIPARSSELTFEGGSAIVRGETPTIGVSIEWPNAGPVNTDYELGFNLIGSSASIHAPLSCRQSSAIRYEKLSCAERGPRPDNRNAFVLRAMLWDGWKKFELGLGFGYVNVEQEYTCQFVAALGARWRFTDRVAVQARHFSSGGSCKPNVGRDLLTIGWRF